jgi:phosphoribosylanthranilate isomerase
MKFKVEIKICGINSYESAKASIGAEYIGFVFYPKSPRFLNAFDAKEIASYLDPTQKKVGLFVNADINVIKHISDFVNLDMIQLHGDETIEDIKIIKKMIKKPIIKALPVNTDKDIKNSKKIEEVCDMILFDSKTNIGISGGTGKPFDWNLLKNLKLKKKWLLAGGLNINNIEEALSITNAPVVDVSSGVEIKKGIKCEKKIKNLINYLKNEN